MTNDNMSEFDALPTIYAVAGRDDLTKQRRGRSDPRASQGTPKVGEKATLRRRNGRPVRIVMVTSDLGGGTFTFKSVRGGGAEGRVITMMQNIPARMLAVETKVAEMDPCAIAKKVAEQIGIAQRVEVVVTEGKKRTVRDVGPQHFMFKRLLKTCNTVDLDGKRLNVWIAGPAGSGKSKAAEFVAKALGLAWYITGAVFDKSELLGFVDANSKYRMTMLYKCWEFGGVFCWDDIDRSDAQAFAAFNAMLGGTVFMFPDGRMVERHKDCVLIATANTWGEGPDAIYVGACPLDKATLNRFVKMPWGYDEQLETQLSGNAAWAARVQTVRSRVQAHGMKVLITPRATFSGAALLAGGMPQHEVEEMCLSCEMTPAQWKTVSA